MVRFRESEISTKAALERLLHIIMRRNYYLETRVKPNYQIYN